MKKTALLLISVLTACVLSGCSLLVFKTYETEKKLDAEKPKFEKGTYNAYIEVHRGAKFPPLSEEEIYSLIKNLDGLAAASKEEYTDAVCGSAELGVSSDDLCREYHDLERALYVAEPSATG